MQVPLQLSPDYIRIEDRNDRIKVLGKKNKTHQDKPSNTYKDSIKLGQSKGYFYTMQVKNPLKYRFIRFHGKGDMVAGFIYYGNYFDALSKETQEILKILTVNREKKKFATHIDIDKCTLSKYINMKKVKAKFWSRMLTMRKIVRGFDTFKERKWN